MPLAPGVLDELRRALGPDGLVVSPEGRLVYECDMHTFYKGAPDAVALPASTAEVAAIVTLCRRERVPIVPRGSGTGLIGGAMAPLGGVMIGLNRMTRILEIDLANRSATVQPGLINLWLTRAVQDRGWFFAPDPSSQMVSSIGGNVATNAGGPHCLKYGITANHVVGPGLVTGAREVVRLGGTVARRAGPAGDRDLPRARRPRRARGARRERARATLEGTQGGGGRGGTAGADVPPAGRGGAPLEAPPDHARAPRDRRAPSRADRQRVPRGRRQPPPAHPLRRPEPRGARARAGGQRGAAPRVHRDGRHGHGRARRRARQGQEPPAPVRRGRSELHGSASPRLRPRPDHESRQAPALAPGVRRGVPTASAAGAGGRVGLVHRRGPLTDGLRPVGPPPNHPQDSIAPAEPALERSPFRQAPREPDFERGVPG